MNRHIPESKRKFKEKDIHYFSERLSTKNHWRLFPEFRSTIAYLDIETTGLGGPGDHITTITLYDGAEIHYYIHGENLEKFKKDIQKYQLIVSYNGKCFDVPFIQRYFRVTLDQAHIDLRYVLKSLGYTGGLKACESKLGLDRKELTDVDGFFAVLLWNDYKRAKNIKSLETLLAYNIQDAVNLEMLIVKAYNKKLRETPFLSSHHIPDPVQPKTLFKADVDTIHRIKRNYGWI